MRHAARRRTSARPRPRGPQRSPARRPARGAEAKELVRHHRSDLAGVGFLALGVVALLGIVPRPGRGAGPSGSTPAWPPWSAWSASWRRRSSCWPGCCCSAGARATARRCGRWSASSALLIAVTGLLHLLLFSQGGDPVADLGRAGGGLGRCPPTRSPGRGRHARRRGHPGGARRRRSPGAHPDDDPCRLPAGAPPPSVPRWASPSAGSPGSCSRCSTSAIPRRLSARGPRPSTR